MCKIEKLDDFMLLTKKEKKNLTLSWLIEFIKKENLSIEDVVDIINNIEPVFLRVEKLECLLLNDEFYTSTISRLFGFGYAKSVKVINFLLQKNLIVKFEKGYKVIDKSRLKDIIDEIRRNK